MKVRAFSLGPALVALVALVAFAQAVLAAGPVGAGSATAVQSLDAGAKAADAGAGSADAGAVWSACSEYLPRGASRPKIDAHLPARGLSGYAVRLLVVVSHGGGETVMPGGFHLQRGSDAMHALEEAGWIIPEPDAGVGPVIDRPSEEASAGASSVTTTLSLPFVPLPKEPGRHRLVLPPLPISVGRANGQVMTLCTRPVGITVDDPIANEVDPQVKPNPPPRPQREDWPLARQLALGALAIVALALLLAWLIRRYQRRPKVEPPKPKVLPWIAAMEELLAIRSSNLLATDQYDEYIDRVSECTRRYLGDRYGFDGVESTSAEIRYFAGRVYPRLGNLDAIAAFLADTDLIKFAKLEPQREDCELAMDRALSIVHQTTPAQAQRVDAPRGGGRRVA